MRWSVVLTSVVVLAACGGPLARGGALPPEARVDAAVELAARLPRGLHRCAVARPGALSALQRAMFVRLSQGEPLAFLPDAPFVAVASGYITGQGGSRHRISLIRTSADRETVRRFLDERSGLYLSWPGDDDPPRSARLAVRFLDDRTLVVGRLDVEESSRIGAEARCLALASRYPNAFEVASRRGELGYLGDMAAQIPERIDFRATREDGRLTLVRTSTMRDADDLPDFLTPTFDGPMFGWLPLSILAESRESRRDGRRVIETTRLAWEDMMLAAEDARRLERAIDDDARSRGPQPLERIDLSDLATVHHQRQLWQDLIDAPAPRGPRARAQLERLLELAIESHPREAELRAQLFDLLARHVGDASRAADVATAAIRDGVGDASTFAQLRREAYARSDAGRLAAALTADGVVQRREAADAAEAIAGAVLDGADYAFTEGAWIAGRALLRRAYRSPARRVTPVALDLAALVESLGVLAHAADAAGALWVAIEGDRRPWGVARFSAEDAPRIALDVGRSVLIGAASTNGDARLSALGDSLSDSVSPGPIVLSFFVVPFASDASQPATWGRIEGELRDDVLTVQRIAGPAAGVDWDRANRLLVGPLAASRSRVFPAPEVTLSAGSEAEAERLLALSDLTAFVLCRRRAETVTCRGAEARAGAVHDFVVEIAGEMLATEASRLVRGAGR